MNLCAFSLKKLSNEIFHLFYKTIFEVPLLIMYGSAQAVCWRQSEFSGVKLPPMSSFFFQQKQLFQSTAS